MKKVLVIGIVGLVFLLSRCQLGNQGIVIGPKPYQKLSEYNFFKGEMANLEPNQRVLPYDLNSPLFSDYAHKARFVWMPEGQSARFTNDHVLDFPVGTTLIKNFFFNYDETDLSKGRKIVETRILVNRGEEWDAYGYIWNDAQTDADFEIIGDVQDMEWTKADGEVIKTKYIIPNKNQCKGCHAFKNKQMPIGPKARNLDKDFVYTDGPANQLDKWAEVGYLSGYEVGAIPLTVVNYDDESKSIHERAMAYLDINCGHCHNPDGAANTSGLTLLADSELGLPLGVYKATVSAGAGTGGHAYSIVPGSPETSIMIYRMKSTNPGAMMPELGRQLVHEEGVKLIADWIAQMDPEAFEKPDALSID